MSCRHGYVNDVGRLCCLYCGDVAREPEPTMLEKLISNATPEQAPSHNVNYGRRLPPVEAPQHVYDRILAAVREMARDSA